MKLTIDRRLVGSDGNPFRFALTFTMTNAPGDAVDVDEASVRATLAKAADFVQVCLVPESVLCADTAAPRHPQEYALCQRVSEGGFVRVGAIVRIALTTREQFEGLSSAGYRYLTGGHTEDGKLLPVFWTLPIVELGPGRTP